MREAARLVASVRDRSKVDAFAREVAQMVGMDVDEVRTQVRRAEKRSGEPERGRDRRSRGGESGRPDGDQAQQRAAAAPVPDMRDPRFSIERETLKLLLQHSDIVQRSLEAVTVDDFTHPAYRAVWQTCVAHGGAAAAAADAGWVAKVRHSADNPHVAAAFAELMVEPVRSTGAPTETYMYAHAYRLRELTVLRRIGEVKSRLQRTDPSAEEYQQMFTELMELEQRRRDLRDKAVGA